MRRIVVAITVLIAVAGGMLAATAVESSPQGAARAKARIGVYDSRAIAVAYAASRFNPVSEKMGEYEKAKAAGDTDRMEALESWGEKHQRQLHRQGFGRVPVDDLLEHVEARLGEVAREAGVDAIVFSCEYAAPGVETVDVTMQLVKLFDPSAQTLKMIEQMKGKEPLDLDAIEAMGVKE